MDDPIFTSTNIVGGASMRSKFAAMPEKIHADQSFILVQQFTDPTPVPFDISSAVATLYVAGYNNTLDRVALASGVLSDSGGGTTDTVTFTVPKDLIPIDLGSLPQRNPGNSVFFYILEDSDSVLEFAQEVNVIDPSYDLQGSTDPGSSTITTQRNDLGSVEDTTVVTPPAQTFGLAYVVGPAGATGDWAGQENNLAVSNGSSWIFTLPEEGNFVFDKALGAQKVFNGATWEVSAGGDMLSGVYDPQAIAADAFDRANMTGTQDHTTISDYDTELAGTTNVTTFTPTADYHPATKKYVDDATPALSFDDLTDVTLTSVAQGDVLYFNGTAWVNLGPGVNGQFFKTQGPGANPAWETIAGGGDMLASTYDPANISEQLVGLAASQTLTNKTVNGVTLTAAGSSSNFLNEAGNYVTVSSGGGFPTGRVTGLATTGTVNIDWDAGDTFVIGTLTGNTTLTFSNVLQGQTITIDVTGASGFTFDLPASCDIALEGTDFTPDVRNLVHIKAVNAATSQEYVYNLDTASSAGGGILPSVVDDIDDTDYTILVGDIGKRKTLINGTVLREFTLDVSLLADFSEQMSFKNDSDSSLRIVVSNTGTMTIGNTYPDLYLQKGEIVTLAGDTATNADIVARP